MSSGARGYELRGKGDRERKKESIVLFIGNRVSKVLTWSAGVNAGRSDLLLGSNPALSIEWIIEEH